MLTWNEIVQNYIIKYSNQIKKATQPLRDHFGINYFTYHRIYNTGRYTVLLDRPDWAEHYVEQELYLKDPYLRHPSVYQSGTCLFDSHGSEEYKKAILTSAKEILNAELTAIFIHKEDAFVEFFGFTGNQTTSSLQSLHLNHPNLLKSFGVHFKKELGLILNKMGEEGSYLKELKGKDFLCSKPICPNIASATRLAYYHDIGMKCEAEHAEKLSRRERQCLKLLLEEKSAKETAAILGLSRRTIESYFENIKDKLCCWSKQDVLKVARDFEHVGLL